MSDEELTKEIYEAMQVPYLSERHDAIKKLIKQHREAYVIEARIDELTKLRRMFEANLLKALDDSHGTK